MYSIFGAMFAGTNVLLPLSAYAEDGSLVPSYSHYYKYRSSTVHPMDLDESKQNKEVKKIYIGFCYSSVLVIAIVNL